MGNAAILIVGLSARPFVVAAKAAGFQVTAIDGFTDAQTLALADHTIMVDFDEHGFKADDLLNIVSQFESSRFQGFVYASGFDAQPELLQKIASYIPLMGNSVPTVSAVKTGASFFNALQKLDIPHPQILNTWPNGGKYLKKSAGGCGGTHISIATPKCRLDNNQYFQEYIDGRPVSLLFLAQHNTVETIGFNEQWLNASEKTLFRYGGAVGNIELPLDIQQQLIQAAQKLTLEFGLIGLNSLDALIENGTAYVLEVNPRLSATFDLYEDADLFNRHLQAVMNEKTVNKQFNKKLMNKKLNLSKAHAIVYAVEDMTISPSFDWPQWVTDTPALQNEAIHLKAGQPVCTVFANAENAEAAKQLVMARVKMLHSAFR
ncbi:MAG: ATP-grasp domain-containing protein [Methylotenera sp.]|nr:ATP-grasp domain-containing protein [Methylotenera sp.]